MDEEENKYICYYCGLPASTKNHVIPRSVLKKYDIGADFKLYQNVIKNRILLVPACRECNNLLGNTVQKTLQERKQYLKKILRNRYKKVLKMPNWTEEDLKEMGSNLKQSIIAGMNEKKLILQRLSW